MKHQWLTRLVAIASGFLVVTVLTQGFADGGRGDISNGPNSLSTNASTSVPADWFKLGYGYSDIFTRQLVRTSSDKVYLFCLFSTTSNTILA
jgi:hypothetical protein